MPIQSGRQAYTVSQVNAYIRKMFSRDFVLQNIAVKGEVSNCKYHPSGHIYFTLKDGTGALAAVMFAGNRNGLRFVLQEGQQVIVIGGVSVYERSGTYQLYAREIHLDGLGDLYAQLEQLKKKLDEMGLFAQEYKQPIPRFARKVGVVTASTGAAIRDIVNITHRRNPGVQLILYPAIVQGEEAVPSIVRGIETLDAMGLDVLIVGRGGGSIEDLWAFNSEAVAWAVFNCATPVISAVGHETDTTLVDYVADLRAPTPSAAAELAVYDRRTVENSLEEKRKRLTHIMEGRLSRERLQVNEQFRRLSAQSPRTLLENRRQAVMGHERALSDFMNGALQERKTKLKVAAARLSALSPLARIQGGYAFVSNEDGIPVRSVRELSEGERVLVTIRDGAFTAEVRETKPAHTGQDA